MTPDRPDIVLVVFDTARRDRFGCYGYARPTTPTVDSLATAGTVVDTMISNAPWTLPSHASLFTGLYPSQHGAQWRTGRRLNERVQVTLAEFLRRLGYETVCATNNGLVTAETGLARGFDRHVHRSQLERGMRTRARQMQKVVVGGDSGGRVVNRWIRSQVPDVRGPMFLFVNYLECHWPYAPPRRLHREIGGARIGPGADVRVRSELARRVGPWDGVGTADERTLRAYSSLYDAEHRNVDGHLAELLDILSGRGRLDDATVVMVTSDHGEHLGEHGLADHQASLDDHLVRVPFVAWGPGIVPGGRRAPTHEFVDVLPSVARMLGREPPVEPLAERRASLLVDALRSANGASANGAERLAFAEWRSWSDEDLARVSRRNPRYDFTGLARDLVSVRSDRFKLVRTGDRRETLFDLSADPSEERDASAEHPADAARLRAALDGAVASWRSPDAFGDGELSAVDADEIERHLAELGYI
jgi:arylsulfatase A-like enzyme